MKVEFTKDVEARRNSRPTWEIYKGLNLVAAVRKARELGWEENKVQVRRVVLDDALVEYQIEPYETDCRCPNILRYEDYFGEAPSS